MRSNLAVRGSYSANPLRPAMIRPPPALGREALEIAQWAGQSAASAAVQQMAARFAGGDALGALVRERQDLSAAWRDRDQRLAALAERLALL